MNCNSSSSRRQLNMNKRSNLCLSRCAGRTLICIAQRNARDLAVLYRNRIESCVTGVTCPLPQKAYEQIQKMLFYDGDKRDSIWGEKY